MNREIEVMVNGRREYLPEESAIALLIDRFRAGGPSLMVHRNGEYVWQEQYGTTLVRDGDSLELIHIDFAG